jgi:hypothetical protein
VESDRAYKYSRTLDHEGHGRWFQPLVANGYIFPRDKQNDAHPIQPGRGRSVPTVNELIFMRAQRFTNRAIYATNAVWIDVSIQTAFVA